MHRSIYPTCNILPGEPKIRVLIVEDDNMIAEVACADLGNSSYAVGRVKSGAQIAAAVQTQEYDLLPLDLGLPGLDGLQMLARLYGSGCQVPVPIVTVHDGFHSCLHGSNGGASDYIVKPFDMAELQVRMCATLRRNSGQSQSFLSNGIPTLNPVAYQAQIAGQTEPVVLSNKELVALRALMIRPGIIFPRSDLEDKIYGRGKEVESNTVDFPIHLLRKKLDKEHTRNVHDVGWLVEKSGA